MVTKVASWFPDRPKLYIIGWVTWFVVLWILSSGNPAPKNGPDIPHFDKIVHFGYFLGGAGLFAAWRRFTSPTAPALNIIVLTTLVGAIVGAIDEYHQSFTPGRTGNDVYDWLADLTGSFAGVCIMLYILSRKSDQPAA